MSLEKNKALTIWLFVVSFLIVFMVVFGGLVRLTRSGLSIVEWNPVSGVIPPIGEQAWQAEFAKYQQTPEYQKVNAGMTLAEYKEIFLLEYFHRLIARFAGLLVAIPLLYFLFKGIIPWRRSAVYILIGIGFAFQGVLGWYMVSSGLIDRPAVSHFRLTAHLLTALGLLALTLWMALKHAYGFPEPVPHARQTPAFRLAILLMIVLVLQISYGGLVAGLKAGHASDTFPLMFGYLIPPGLLSVVQPWWKNLLETAATVHFVHRWFAFVVLLMALILYGTTRRRANSVTVHRSLLLLMALVVVQILLGISVIWFHVPIVLALLHQFTALCLFIVALFIIYRLVHEPVPYAEQLRLRLGPQTT
ncbi:MAG: heme A synthase [Caldilineae bacterium]|nr:MAG: heme A synthase [Caldilineae bacterium]